MARENKCDSTKEDLYSSLNFCPGETTLPGIRKNVFFTRKNFITKFPKEKDGKLDGSFELAAGKFFHILQVVVDDSKFTSTSQGEYPNKTFRQHLEMAHPVMDEDYAKFEMNANNDDLLYIVQGSNGTFKVVGCEEYRTDTTFTDDSGARATDKAASNIVVECDAPYPCLIYSGTIPISDNEDANGSEANAGENTTE